MLESSRMTIQRITFTTILFCALGMSTVAAGSESDWRWSVAPYLWASGIDITIKDQGTLVGGAAADFSGLVDQTEIGFQLIAEGGPEGGKWNVFTDVTYFEIAGGDTVNAVDVDLDTDAFFLDIGGVYSPAGIGTGIHFLGGVRHQKIDTNIKIVVPGDPVVNILQEDRFTDVLIGARYRFILADKWSLKLRGDVSTGDTEHTWTVEGLFGYQFGKDKDKKFLFGYRHREVEVEVDGLTQEIEMSGPIFAINFNF
jgi:hypothetical protein